MKKSAASKHKGMGAKVYGKGTAFRVWAPHAEKVFVIGSFNEWSKDSDQLASEENGYWSADIQKAKPGDEYKFLIVNGDKELYKNDPYAKEIRSKNNNSVIIDPTFDWGKKDFMMPDWNNLVIYELHIGTFNANDKFKGTFDSVIEKLDYLKNLGINGIEIMPVMEFPSETSWGYNVTYPFAVEQDYGGVKKFKKFVKEAHKKGIAVFIDLVFNHFGPSDMDLWQFDGWNENNKGGIYFYNDDRGDTPWGPRPDYGRPEVREYLKDNVMQWLEEFHLDGVRWDGTNYVRNSKGNNEDPSNNIPEAWDLMKWINKEMQNKFPWKLKIAEDNKGNVWLTKSAEENGAGFDAQWDVHFVHPIKKVLVENEDSSRNLDMIEEAVCYKENNDAFKRIIYMESHDEVTKGKKRIPEEISPGNSDSWFAKKRSAIGAALVFTSPGIPMIFQEQEILINKNFNDKTPIDWSYEKKFSGNLDLYRELIRLRRNLNNTTGGLTGQNVKLYHKNDKDKLIAYYRWNKGGSKDDVIIIINFADKNYENYSIGFPSKGLWKVRFNSDSNQYDPEYGNFFSPDIETEKEERDGLPFSGNIKIGGYSVLIYSQD